MSSYFTNDTKLIHNAKLLKLSQNTKILSHDLRRDIIATYYKALFGNTYNIWLISMNMLKVFYQYRSLIFSFIYNDSFTDILRK